MAMQAKTIPALIPTYTRPCDGANDIDNTTAKIKTAPNKNTAGDFTSFFVMRVF